MIATTTLWVLLTAGMNLTVASLVRHWVSRSKDQKGWWIEGVGLFFRVAVFFGMAHLFWQRYQRTEWLVILILTAAVLQLAGQTALYFRSQKVL